MASSLLLQSGPFLPAKLSSSTTTALKPRTLHLPLSLKPVSHSRAYTSPPKFVIRASASTPPKLSDSTRTIASLAAISVSVTIAKLLLPRIAAAWSNLLPTVQDLEAIRSIGCDLGRAGGPMFFAAIKDSAKAPTKTYLNTPLTVVAAGLGKWLDIYSGVLMIRVLLSWFPNVSWDRQPMNAIRDLCDTYLNLFRSVIPPLFNTVGISPLVLGRTLHLGKGKTNKSQTRRTRKNLQSLWRRVRE